MKKMILFVCFLLLICGLNSLFCNVNRVSSEKLEADKRLKELFYALHCNDTLVFINKKGRIRKFSLSKIDSVIDNKDGGFGAGPPSKELSFYINEVSSEYPRKDSINTIFLTKNINDSLGKVYIGISTFIYMFDNVLPSYLDTTLTINSVPLVFNLLLTNKAIDLIKNYDDIVNIGVNKKFGITSFQTFSKEWWIRK